MRAVVQRVKQTSVTVEGRLAGAIERGLLVYLGVDRDDTEHDVHYLAEKVRYLRIFAGGADKLNLDVVQAGGGVLAVSAFTVQGDARRGRRPSFEQAAAPDRAYILYQLFCDALVSQGVNLARGSFGDTMSVASINDGPVCVLLESRRAF